MMSVVYKLISKLLLERFSPHCSNIINLQHIGFILGRYILENVSLVWLLHDWVPHHKIPTLLILLDSEKAFNKVEHNFIWDVLKAVGLGGTFLKLVQSLLSHAILKVHINDNFIAKFKVTRGVRQGCPLSPLIFSLPTQPLMELL